MPAGTWVLLPSASVGRVAAEGLRNGSQPFPCGHLPGHPEHSSVSGRIALTWGRQRTLWTASLGPTPRVSATPLALLAQVLGQVVEEEAQLALHQLPVGEEDAGDVGLLHGAWGAAWLPGSCLRGESGTRGVTNAVVPSAAGTHAGVVWLTWGGLTSQLKVCRSRRKELACR